MLNKLYSTVASVQTKFRARKEAGGKISRRSPRVQEALTGHRNVHPDHRQAEPGLSNRFPYIPIGHGFLFLLSFNWASGAVRNGCRTRWMYRSASMRSKPGPSPSSILPRAQPQWNRGASTARMRNPRPQLPPTIIPTPHPQKITSRAKIISCTYIYIAHIAKRRTTYRTLQNKIF